MFEYLSLYLSSLRILFRVLLITNFARVRFPRTINVRMKIEAEEGGTKEKRNAARFIDDAV